jgi:S1-C subfamily serine protease
MKKIVAACLLISATFYSTAIIAQSNNDETIIIDDKNTESKTVIEIEKNGDVLIDGKKVATRNDQGDKIKIIKKKTFISTDENQIPFDAPLNFQGNKALLGVKTKEAKKGGAEVIEVIPNSAAEKALIKVGDVITMVDDVPIKNPEELAKKIGEYNAGDDIKLKIENENESYTARTTLDKNEPSTVRIFENENISDIFKGLDIEKMFPKGIMGNTSEAKPKFGMTVEENDTKGLKVVEVQPNSIAAKAGLQVGDIILEVEKNAINNPEQFVQQASNNMQQKNLNILIKRGDYEKSLSMEIPKVRRRAEL